MLGRLIAALGAKPGAACPVCAGTGIIWRQDLDREPRTGPVCTGCGIVVPRPVLTAKALAEARGARTRALASAA